MAIDSQGREYLDHMPGCNIYGKGAGDRACTCTVVFPFPNPAGRWDGWMTLSEAEQNRRWQEYRDKIKSGL